MISVGEYVARDKRFVKALEGRVIESVYRVELFDDDGCARCEGLGELIVFHDSGSLLFAIDEGYRNLFLYQAEGTRSFERERALLEDEDGCPLSVLVGRRVERVSGLRRPGEFADHGIFCGVSIHTVKGVAHIGGYLTDIDDAGVCLLRTDQLHESIESFEIDLDAESGGS